MLINRADRLSVQFWRLNPFIFAGRIDWEMVDGDIKYPNTGWAPLPQPNMCPNDLGPGRGCSDLKQPSNNHEKSQQTHNLGRGVAS